MVAGCATVPTQPDPDVVASRIAAAEAIVARARNAAEFAITPDRLAQRSTYLEARDALAAGRPRDALELIDTLLRLQPANWVFHAALVQALYFGLHDAERALDASGRCLDVDAAVLECLEVRALALLDLGRASEAALALETYLIMNPADRRARELLARTLLQQGMPDQAAELARALLRDAPDHIGLHILLAHAEERAGRLQAAEGQFRHVANLHRDPVMGRSHLLRFYERNGRDADAQRLQREIERSLRPAPRRRLDPL